MHININKQTLSAAHFHPIAWKQTHVHMCSHTDGATIFYFLFFFTSGAAPAAPAATKRVSLTVPKRKHVFFTDIPAFNQ